MSLLIMTNSSGKNEHNRDVLLIHCKKYCGSRNTKDIAVYNTVILRVAEIFVIVATILLNSLLIAAISKPRCNFTVGIIPWKKQVSLN